jgi:hypothetical protein
MNNRVYFYERQYLNASDLVAEQAYHLEMRRRLNLALHLWGIVLGFDIAKGSVVPGAPEQFIVGPGMAIDGFGREIVLPVAYALSGEDLRRNRVQVPQDYWLSIAYRRELTTPPASGYRLCDVKDQFTRWHESYAILITPDEPSRPPAPTVIDPLPDDPTGNDWPVVLGKVRVVSSGGNLTIDSAWLESRVYVGSRTEHLVSPVASLPSGIAEARRPIRIQADGLAEKNLAIGEDFVVDKTKVKPPPAAATFPTDSGNLKAGTDLFVRGEIYKRNSATGEWLALKEDLAQLMPDIQLPAQSLPLVILTALNSASTAPSTGTLTVSITTRLLNPSKANLVVALAGIKWLSHQNEGTWIAAVTGNAAANTAPIQVSVRVLPNPTKTNLAGGTQYDFQVEWSVGPTIQPSVTPPLPVLEVHVTCFGIFLP